MKTLAELAQQLDVHLSQITQWRSRLLEGAVGVFGSAPTGVAAAPTVDVKMLHAKIGELTLSLANRDREKPCGSPSHTTGHRGPCPGGSPE